ncbi:unnamed protein product [Brachionus calyciflorus]|uniref:Peptidase S1 domain-containing protein n=1 Tax=Brachionus calyciflorus TaxID=104777 RepID=A0A814G0C0_9BILA|nr:unnamed protein product [Brachionus calyciflorus]
MIIKNNKSQERCYYRRYNNYCALGESDDSNVCYGDSGGPLQYFKNGKWYVYGIASFVYVNGKYCVNTLPSFYAAVPYYLDWIKRVATGKLTQPSVKKICGVRTQKNTVAVNISENNAWPWIVQVRFLSNYFLEFPLSGTLISNQHVLTLNNKIFNGNLKNIYVALDSNELVRYPQPDKIYTVISVKKISKNFVVLKLHRPVTNPNVSPICLPDSSQSSLIFDKQLRTAGWGSFNRTGSVSSYLKETSLTVKNNANECMIYSTSSYCTFAEETNMCIHDLGSPVMYSIDNKWTIFGIYYQLTNGKKCDMNKMALAFNIVKNIDKIKSAIK